MSIRVWGAGGAAAIAMLAGFTPAAWGGGPRLVAGSSFFDASVKGQPVVWAGGQLRYFTDQGDLSAEVNQAQANAMVVAAAAVWNNVATAAVSIQPGGSLAEDVSGANVVAGSGGVSLPPDIQPTATGTPVGIVYDADGSVIDAIEGTGASSPLACENNGVLATVDNFSTSGQITHALVLVNGLCATTADQIATLQYQLVRAFGRVLGLDWSQANEAMFTGAQATNNGLAGWPLMHPIERLCNATSGGCLPNPMQSRLDDVAALNRLYPVTAANIANFSGKTITAAATLSVQGTIAFSRGQGMQGINVVLRPVINGVPDVRYTVTAVSGAFFEGNAGNPVTGKADADGNPLNRFGSDDGAMEGFFDLSGVPLPPGVASADYQLSFEAVNPLYTGNVSVGPYTTGQVAPSGTLPVIDLGTLGAGSAITQGVVVNDSADEAQSGADGVEESPAELPATGEWTGRITGYGHSGWFEFHARGSRAFTVEAQALDEDGADSEAKAQVVIGAWNGSDAVGTAPVTGTAQPFNGQVVGLTTLPVLTIADSEVRIGVADFRGDGRPDFAYRGRVFYADRLAPARLPASGGQMVIVGMGFGPNVTVLVNDVAAQVQSVTPTTIVAIAPASGGAIGNVVVQVEDTQTLAMAAIASGFSYDAQNDDALSIVSAPAGALPTGLPVPFTVRALNVGTQTPAPGVTVTFSLTQGVAGLGCGQSSCTAMTAADGTATMVVTANTAAPAQVAAALTNGSSALAEFTGTAPAGIHPLTPPLYLALGATVQFSADALVLNGAGLPLAGESVTWSAATPGLSMASSSGVSDSSGVATIQLTAGPFASSSTAAVQACLAGTPTCTSFDVIPVHPETASLVAWSGTLQYLPAGQSFAPVVLHVVDAFGHALAGAMVSSSQSLFGWTEPCPAEGRCPAAPLQAQSAAVATSGVDGAVTLTPLATTGLPGRLMVEAVTAGGATLNLELDAHP